MYSMDAIKSPIKAKESGRGRKMKSVELVRYLLKSPYSKKSLDRNQASFHRCVSNSLRKAVVLVLDKILKSEIGEEVVLTIKFNLKSIPSDRLIKSTGKISDNYVVDPSMSFNVIMSDPEVE